MWLQGTLRHTAVAVRLISAVRLLRPQQNRWIIIVHRPKPQHSPHGQPRLHHHHLPLRLLMHLHHLQPHRDRLHQAIGLHRRFLLRWR